MVNIGFGWFALLLVLIQLALMLWFIDTLGSIITCVRFVISCDSLIEIHERKSWVKS
jgi:hypothetical protein